MTGVIGMRSTAVAMLLQRGLELGSNAPALIRGQSALSFSELAQKITGLVGHLMRRGLTPGHRLAIVCSDSYESLIILLAALDCGLSLTILSPSLGRDALEFRLQQFKPDAIIHGLAELNSFLHPSLRNPVSDASQLIVLWTSGTSGTPKGVAFHPCHLLWNARTNARVLGICAHDRTLLLLDIAYCYGLVHQVMSHLIVGASVVFPIQCNLHDSILANGALLPTTLATVPAMLRTLVEVPRLRLELTKLRFLTVGGQPAPEEFIENVQEALPGVQLVLTYGLTEAGPRVVTRFFDSKKREMRKTVGFPLPGVMLRLGQDAEIQVKSPSACVGYMRDGNLVARNGWLHTADVGNILPNGALQIVGRRAEYINRGGVKISPSEIEDLLRHYPGVRHATVLASKHARLGEVPVAILRVERGQKIDTLAVKRLCMVRLGPGYTPSRIDIVE